jgi:hypothetical protein
VNVAIRLAVPAILVAAFVASADDKKKEEGKSASSEQDYKKLGQIHELAGKLLHVQAKDKTLTVEIEYQFLEPKNKNALKQMNAHQRKIYKEQQQLLIDQQKVLASRNPAQAAKHLRQLQQHNLRLQQNELKANDLFKVSTGRKDFDLEAVLDVKVRLAKLPVEYDDMGKVQKLTDQELKERKGSDPNLPGYSSTFGELMSGQMVKLTLGKPASKATSNSKDDADDHPKVTMIVVTRDVDPTKATKKQK